MQTKMCFKETQRIFKIAWNYNKCEILISGIVALLLGVGGGLNVIFVKYFFQYLESESNFFDLLSFCLIIISIEIFLFVLKGVYDNSAKPFFRTNARKKMETDLFDQIKRIKLKSYDSEEFYDTLTWVSQNYVSQVFRLVDAVISIITLMITLATVISVLFTISVFIIIAILVLCLFHSAINRKRAIKDKKFDESMIQLNRRIEYIESVFVNPKCAKEIRCTLIYDKIISEYFDNVSKEYKNTVLYNKKIESLSIIEDLFLYLPSPMIYLYLFYNIAVTNTIAMSSLAVTYASVLRLNNVFDTLFEIGSEIMRCQIYFNRIIDFFDKLDSQNDGLENLDSFKDYDVKNISFSYDSSQSVINNLSMSIRSGERIAIVGLNGSGKSTLIKLLLRLYSPESGNIWINNLPINNYSSESLYSKIGVVFQDFSIYALSVEENILMDRVTDCKIHDIQEAVDVSNLRCKVDELKYGLKTVLSKEFGDGTELSGGEKQRVALARVFSRDYDIIVMDEPSSALDPISEYEFNNKVLSRTIGKTVILVSHRLSTTRYADRIIVMKNGSIIENGSHKELMELKGEYYELFNLQSQYYKQ